MKCLSYIKEMFCAAFVPKTFALLVTLRWKESYFILWPSNLSLCKKQKEKYEMRREVSLSLDVVEFPCHVLYF